MSTPEIYTLSLHDALPIFAAAAEDDGRRGGGRAFTRSRARHVVDLRSRGTPMGRAASRPDRPHRARSEEHTSELQSLRHLVCRLLLEKKNKTTKIQSNEEL